MPSNTVKTSDDCALGLLISTCIMHIVTSKLCDLSKLAHLGITATSLSKMLNQASKLPSESIYYQIPGNAALLLVKTLRVSLSFFVCSNSSLASSSSFKWFLMFTMNYMNTQTLSYSFASNNPCSFSFPKAFHYMLAPPTTL